MPTVFRTWATAFVGLLLLQAVWLLVIPPFEGMDEHDHVFKAAAVARGDWSTTHESVEVGRGELVAVPRDIVEAARPACEMLPYTRRDDCRASATLPDLRVLVGSAAARYNPIFYAVVGTAALPFEGTDALNAMRIATAIWCAGLLALAISVIRRTARTPWPTAAVLAACTPTMLYATSITAPNGPEMAAGLLLWCTLFFGTTREAAAPRWVVVAGTVAAIHVALLRSLGPLWLALILGTAALAIGTHAFLRTARAPRYRLPIVATSVAVVAAVLWTLASGTNNPSVETGPGFPGSPWSQMAENSFVWVLQQVAAVPSRNVVAPLVVYELVLSAWTMLLVLVLLVAPLRARIATLTIFASTIILSIGFTLASYESVGYAWQGRYAWPYVVGWLVLAGWVLETSAKHVPGARTLSAMAGVAIGVGAAATAVDVLLTFRAESPYLDNGWSPPHPLVVAGLVAVGVITLLLSLLPRRTHALTTTTTTTTTGSRRSS